jgi:hypothetical protein
MKRYEYKVIDTGKHLEEQLNELGAQGYSRLWVPACARSAVSRTVSSRAWTRTCAPEPTPNVQ